MRTYHIVAAGLMAATAMPGVIAGNETGRDKIHAALERRIAESGDSTLIRLAANKPRDEREQRIQDGMEFLYAYMPLADLLNNGEDFYRANVEASIEAQDSLPWGSIVPEREFRHFVLPVRVNNEDLDISRLVFYRSLKERVKGMTMEEAILEVNHWCHERVTYQPSDARTSSSLSTVNQAIGRCGEESTFTVAALRAIGIPARQVYTPRWAHTDDNHAWVEAWANGRWYFLGACEPEPILNLAWFNSPASRGMLMTTRAYGDYDGPEEEIDRSNTFTNINVTSNYASVKPVEVIVKDRKGRKIEDAEVRFCLYNYSEYFPLARKRSNKEGKASLTTGEGDLIVWATDGNKFGYTKANSGMKQPVEIILDQDSRSESFKEFDIVPPPINAKLPKPTEAQAAENELRKAKEDSIRGAYTAGFMNKERALAFANELKIEEADDLVKILIESRGNHRNITDFLNLLKKPQRTKAIRVLKSLCEKDKRDIPLPVVADRLEIPELCGDLYEDYVLNPRVDTEGLRPFVRKFLKDFTDAEIAGYRNNPDTWVSRVSKEITIDTAWSPLSLRIHPRAVWREKRANKISRDIFFVASARAFGIPARIDQITGKTQWHDGQGWRDVRFDNENLTASAATPTGRVNFTFTPTGRITDPVYYSNFSLSKIDNGEIRLLDLDAMMPLSEVRKELETLDAGQYVLTTGQRMADGSVLARTELFTLKAGEEKNVPVTIRQDMSGIQVIGGFNSENLYRGRNGQIQNLLSTTGRGYYTLIYAKPNHEPTSHVLNDISAMADAFEADGRKVMLIYGDADQLERAQLERFPSLPGNIVAGSDIDGAILAELTRDLHLTEGELPIVIVADTFNRVVFVSQGYNIGMGEKLIDVLNRVE